MMRTQRTRWSAGLCLQAHPRGGGPAPLFSKNHAHPTRGAEPASPSDRQELGAVSTGKSCLFKLPTQLLS